MKAGPHLEQCGHLSANPHFSRGGGSDARQDLEEGRLPRSVPTDDPHGLPRRNIEVHISQRPEVLLHGPSSRNGPEWRLHDPDDRLADRSTTGAAQNVTLSKAASLNDRRGHLDPVREGPLKGAKVDEAKETYHQGHPQGHGKRRERESRAKQGSAKAVHDPRHRVQRQ